MSVAIGWAGSIRRKKENPFIGEEEEEEEVLLGRREEEGGEEEGEDATLFPAVSCWDGESGGEGGEGEGRRPRRLKEI